MSLLAELKRRKVFKVGAAYLVVAWLAVQAASIGFPAFNAPLWALRIFILVSLIGFPVAVVLAWVFDATPDSIVLDRSSRGSKLVFGAAALLTIFAVGWYFYGQPSFRKGDAQTPAAAASAVTAAIPRKSIAVLPFTDLSPTHDQEYFSDGMAEELLNALAKIKDLKVAGRSSSFSFKGKNEDLRSVGKELAVANVLEGSVRKQGDKVRITAQLIQAEDGYQLWSESYDGDLSDVFALQERIARAITDKLAVVLTSDPQQPLVPVATTNPEAYALYLQATSIFNRRDGTRFPDAIAQLEQALRLDPKFARAHARLAAIMSIAPTYMVLDPALAVAAVDEHARRASELDPTLAEPYAALGQSFFLRRRYLQAREDFERALALDAGDSTANFWYASGLIVTGYRIKGLELLDRRLAADPMFANALLWRGVAYADDGDIANAERLLQRAADAKLAFAGFGLSIVSAARHQQDQAIEQLSAALAALDPGLPKNLAPVLARGIVGDEQARSVALGAIDAFLAGKPAVVPGTMIYALIRMDEPARALALLKERPTSTDAVFLQMFWSLRGHTVRTLPEFSEFARKIGLAELWDHYGAPDGCHKDAGGDYVCE